MRHAAWPRSSHSWRTAHDSHRGPAGHCLAYGRGAVRRQRPTCRARCPVAAHPPPPGGASSVAGLAVVALAVSAVLSSGSEPSPAGTKSHNFSPIARSPLALRIAASQVSLGSDVFIWGGETTLDKPQGREASLPRTARSTRRPLTAVAQGGPLTADGAGRQAPAVATPRGVLVVGGSRVDDLLACGPAQRRPLRSVEHRWTTIPDAPFCPHLAVPQGSLVYAYGTTCDASDKPAFGWYDVDPEPLARGAPAGFWHPSAPPVPGLRWSPGSDGDDPAARARSATTGSPSTRCRAAGNSSVRPPAATW